MKFKIQSRDGLARIGKFEIEKKEIKTPAIFYLKTKRFDPPSFADVFLTNIDLSSNKPSLKFSKNIFLEKPFKIDDEYYFEIKNLELIIVKYASQLFDQPKKFVDFIVKLREKVEHGKTIYAPSIGNPSNIALLTYLGFDFFDSSYLITAARNNTLVFSDREEKKEDLTELPCNCPVCNKIKNPLNMNFTDILHHNYYAFNNELKTVRNAIKKGNLRNLVEKKVAAKPNLTAILRNLDRNHYSYLEKTTSITSKNTIYANSKESMTRPEIKRFQERVINRYNKPDSAKILLLLPCSAKKPYSFSKTHKFFRETINSSGNPNVIHDLIITSPLGIVPRELELVYPAAHYDIPVTGVWDEDEKKMIRTLLSEYLKKNKYDYIIFHLPDEIMEFLHGSFRKPIITCVEKPTSKKSLEKLSKQLQEKVKQFDKVKNQTRLKENLQCLAMYQFGIKNGEKLIKNTSVKGKYPSYKIMENNTQLGMLNMERGLLSLTINGAEKIQNTKDYWVEIFDDFDLVGSVFAPGIKDVDEQIRIGDEVLVFRNKKLSAVGVAKMNGLEMKKSKHGEAVKIRHRI